MRSTLLFLPLALLPGVALAGPPRVVEATKGPVAHAPSACGSRFIPLAVDDQWTYEPIAAPQPPDASLKPIIPVQPNRIVVTVKSIEKSGKDTVVHLEERVSTAISKDPKKPITDERVVQSTITCNDKKFEVSPDSIFFAGEPGGYLGLTLDNFDRSRDTSWKLNKGAISEHPWREDISAHWTRVPTPGSDAKLGSGTLVMERVFTPEDPEVVITKLANYPRADKVALVTTGRVHLDSDPETQKPTELPKSGPTAPGWISTFWFVNNVGMVQVLNSYGHMYLLVDAKLK